MPALPEFVERLAQQYLRKLLRYCGVSVFNLFFGQSLLFFFHSILDWPGWIANITAVMISAVPAYLLSRHWVWGQRGRNSFKTEVLPFWSMAFLGLIISTVAVAIVDDRYDGALPVQLASVGLVRRRVDLEVLRARSAHVAPRARRAARRGDRTGLIGGRRRSSRRPKPRGVSCHPTKGARCIEPRAMCRSTARSSRSAATAESRRCISGPRRASEARCSSRSTIIGAARRTNRAGCGTSPIWSTPRWARSTRCRSSGARSTTPGSKAPSSPSSVIPQKIAEHWSPALALVFIDGGHGVDPAHRDYAMWSPRVRPGGYLVIHDVFPDPADGGRPPFEIYCRALESGSFVEVDAVGSLRVLRRTA